MQRLLSSGAGTLLAYKLFGQCRYEFSLDALHCLSIVS
jgi:hypothetical protein